MGGYIGATAVGLTTTAADVQGDITSTDTTPELILKNTSEEDTEGGREGKITFKGEQSGGEETTLAQIESAHDGTSDDEKGDLIFKTNDGNDGAAPTERLRLDSAGDMLLSSPDPSFTITNTTEEDTDGGRESTIVFKGEQSGGELSTLAEIEASHDGTADDEKGDLIFRTNDGSDGASPTEAMRIDSSSRVAIGTTTPENYYSTKFVISTGDEDGMTFVGGTGDRHYIMFADGTSGDARYKGYFSYDHATNDMEFATDGTARLNIDASGNVLVKNGVLYLDDNGSHNGIINAPASLRINVDSDNGGTGESFQIGTNATNIDSNNILFRVNDTGETLIGTSTVGAGVGVGGYTLGLTIEEDFGAVIKSTGGAGFEALDLINAATSGTRFQIYFRDGTSAGVRGSITTNGSSTAYNTTSDYRLKENVTDVTDGITRIKQLAPKRFNFIADPDTTVDGFLAHEAQTVVPEAVTGTHNEVDDNGDAKMQGIDQAKLVPLLTAALQEAIAKIETLETKVAALEGA